MMNENQMTAILSELTERAAKDACAALKNAVTMLADYGSHIGQGRRECALSILASIGKAQKHLVGMM